MGKIKLSTEVVSMRATFFKSLLGFTLYASVSNSGVHGQGRIRYFQTLDSCPQKTMTHEDLQK